MERAFELSEARGARYPRHAGLLPSGTLESGRWRARFARRPSELDDVLRLRYEVFNLELGEGLEQSHATHRDEDRFDGFCHHLLVEERASGSVVGTYRMQTSEMAREGCGFYSAGEYDLAKLPAEILEDSIEVGRACIHRDHRHKQVLFLLWQGLAAYVRSSRKRFLFGCSSLASQDPAVKASACTGSSKRRATCTPRSWCRHSRRCGVSRRDLPINAAARDVATGDGGPPVLLPTLFRTYLRYGAKVVSEPALDREFKTIDYLLLLDVAGVSLRTRQVFFGGQDPLGASDESGDRAGR